MLQPLDHRDERCERLVRVPSPEHIDAAQGHAEPSPEHLLVHALGAPQVALYYDVHFFGAGEEARRLLFPASVDQTGGEVDSSLPLAHPAALAIGVLHVNVSDRQSSHIEAIALRSEDRQERALARIYDDLGHLSLGGARVGVISTKVPKRTNYDLRTADAYAFTHGSAQRARVRTTVSSASRPRNGSAEECVEYLMECHRAAPSPLPFARPHASLDVDGVELYFEKEMSAAFRSHGYFQGGSRLVAHYYTRILRK